MQLKAVTAEFLRWFFMTHTKQESLAKESYKKETNDVRCLGQILKLCSNLTKLSIFTLWCAKASFTFGAVTSKFASERQVNVRNQDNLPLKNASRNMAGCLPHAFVGGNPAKLDFLYQSGGKKLRVFSGVFCQPQRGFVFWLHNRF